MKSTSEKPTPLMRAYQAENQTKAKFENILVPTELPPAPPPTDEMSARPGHARTSGNDHHDPDFRHVPPDSDAFRQAILERANAPFPIPRQPRDWGLNE